LEGNFFLVKFHNLEFSQIWKRINCNSTIPLKKVFVLSEAVLVKLVNVVTWFSWDSKYLLHYERFYRRQFWKRLNLNCLILAHNPIIYLEDSEFGIWHYKFYHIVRGVCIATSQQIIAQNTKRTPVHLS